jgi:hypothetical protein
MCAKTIFAVKTTNNDSRRMQARNIESKHQQVEQARQEEPQALAHNSYSICGQLGDPPWHWWKCR